MDWTRFSIPSTPWKNETNFINDNSLYSLLYNIIYIKTKKSNGIQTKETRQDQHTKLRKAEQEQKKIRKEKQSQQAIISQ